jgi:hypothetical protein
MQPVYLMFCFPTSNMSMKEHCLSVIFKSVYLASNTKICICLVVKTHSLKSLSSLGIYYFHPLNIQKYLLDLRNYCCGTNCKEL